jgi:crotonobetainyl-CoA hydratase
MEQIDVARGHGVLEITLRNPKVNAIGVSLSRELGKAFLEFMDNDLDHVAILSGGSGPVFSAGWDMKAAVAAGEGETSDYGPGGFGGLTELFALTKPVVAAVNGIAVGGGVELILACDLIVAADTASFQLPETALGVLADAGGVQRLPRRLPYHVAMELLLTGRSMPAREAAQYGLVNWVVPRDQVMDKARQIARELATRAPLSVRAIKETVRGTLHLSEEEAFARIKRREFATYRRMLESSDREEGPKAFVEKRSPRWSGR